jgi:hypothetical protein
MSWRIACHLMFASAFAMAQVAVWQTISRPERRLWSPEYIETMLCTVMLYAVFVGLSSYQEIAGWLRERETATSRLRAEVAEAQFVSAGMRFEPERMLDRLERAAESMLGDSDGAEAELTGLADDLRDSLDAARQIAPPLATEPVGLLA